MYYLLLFGSIAFGGILLSFKGKTAKAWWLWSVVLLLVSALRWDVGNDFLNYVHVVDSGNVSYGLEILTSLIFWLSIKLHSFHFFLVVSSAIIVLGYTTFILEFCENKFVAFLAFSVLGYFFVGSLNLIQQFMSISLFLLSLVYYKRKQYLVVFIYLMLSIMTHTAGVVGLVYYSFLYSTYSKTRIIFAAIGFFLVLMLIPKIISFLGYNIYLDSRWAYSMNNDRNPVLLLGFILSNILFVVLMLILRFKHRVIYIMQMLSLFLVLGSLLFSELPNMIFFRINNYFMPAMLVGLSVVFARVKFFFLKGLMVVSFVTLMFFYVKIEIYKNGEEINLIPYESWVMKRK